MNGVNSALLGCVLLGFSLPVWSDHTNKVNYEGTLISLACMVDEDRPVEVDLGVVEDKRLYLHENSNLVPFSLTLKNCDASLANSVTVTLQGTPGSVTPDGYLMLDKNSVADGVVLGIMDDNATQGHIAIGSGLPKIPVKNGTMAIPLSAYLHIKPIALANKTVVPGTFSATLYYSVSFE
ncbi:MAG: fimbrial protein [Providencia sp.]|uniref:fimbrial protein n=1 Tax=Providencia sp. TaxID=589 RepID=UPI003F9915BC